MRTSRDNRISKSWRELRGMDWERRTCICNLLSEYGHLNKNTWTKEVQWWQPQSPSRSRLQPLNCNGKKKLLFLQTLTALLTSLFLPSLLNSPSTVLQASPLFPPIHDHRNYLCCCQQWDDTSYFAPYLSAVEFHFTYIIQNHWTYCLPTQQRFSTKCLSLRRKTFQIATVRETAVKNNVFNDVRSITIYM